MGCTLGWDPAPPTAVLCLDMAWLVGAVIQGPRQQSWGGPPICIAHDQRLMPTQKAGLLQLQGGTLAAALAEGLGGCSPADPMSWLSFLPLHPSGPK